ncbi:Copper binding protein, plastocyanin/azurin family [Natronorubrum sediminis]|uniref:Copper binding protein, plastocyanin/azurin family n=1 Tax=Natronorubrum sediminis TaxID=640943 RepID=A0A1H6G1B7_9EURY|nr:PQQ-dependent sugar dehydrogenase [Natronorubrum sediminis]SEH16881.1 Copper binding protein, plastocyanin/azurin family [Natronorubrum sediminis]
MSYPDKPADGIHDGRITRQSRRTVLRALAATGSATALGGVAGVQAQEDEDDPDEDVEEADDDEFGDIPVAGEFPEGETVGLQLMAANIPAPTDFDYVEVNGEVYHFIVTQTGQVFATNLEEDVDEIDDEDDLEDDPDLDDDDEPADDLDEDDVEEEPADEETESFVQETDDEDDEVDDAVDDDGEPTEFVFNGVISAWFGMEPDELDGEENPTLELTAGETYEFTWENGDGQPHNVVILDATDEILERTEIIREAGETQTLEFEATEEMDRYLCEVHPGTMVGSIQVEEEDPDEPDEVDDEVPEDALTTDDMDLFLDIEDQLVSLGIGELGGYDERGLLGIAFHPDFSDNGLFYVRYSAPEREGLGYDHTDVLAEFEAESDGDELSVDPDSERTVMEIQQPQDNHNGGRLAFGPDGYLYTSVGDGGNVHDIGVGHVEDWYDENEGGNAQDTRENLLGGIHRIDVDANGEDEDADDNDELEDENDVDDDDDNGDDDDGEAEAEFGEYGIPDDNPLVDSEEDLGEYWAWGFRNPWGMSIDDDGQVFVSDAGQHAVESIYAVEEGGNYSWNVKEGSFCFSTDSPLEPPEDCPDEVGEGAGEAREGEPLRDPIAEYQHTRISEAFIDSSVVVGGHRYAGEAIPELEDAFVFGNWSSQGVAEADGEIIAAIDPATNGDADDDDELDEDDNDVDDDGETDLVEVDERWELEELQFEGADDESINRYVYGVERDEEGELYVLANTDFRPQEETGEIYKIVPADEGEDVPEPEDPFVVDEEEMDGEEPEAEAPDEEEDDEMMNGNGMDEDGMDGDGMNGDGPGDGMMDEDDDNGDDY